MAGDAAQYLVASREGLYVADRARTRRIAEGAYFGTTVVGNRFYAFRTVPQAQAQTDPMQGAVVRFRWDGETLSPPETVVTGLHHNCHQIDFIGETLFVVDTAAQAIRGFSAEGAPGAVHRLLPPAAHGAPGYAHINSIHGCGDVRRVMFHNLANEKPSEIVEYDSDFSVKDRIALAGPGCHDIVPMDDGTILYCDSFAGSVARTNGWRMKVDDLYTRGLAVGADEVAVGSSAYGKRAARAFLPGFVTFYDGDFNRIARQFLQAAPTQIRRIDGADRSLSTPRPEAVAP